MAMGSEDVIELGSSDDEAEPAVKKIKPTPNAMVHIPRKFHDVTIKPAKLNVSSAIPKELAGKNVTVTKIPKGNVLTNPYAIKNKPNGKPLQIKPILPKQIQQKSIFQKQIPTFSQVPKNSMVNQNKTLNPLSIMKKINSQVVINKVPATPRVLKNPIKIPSPHSINNLPPSITVTRTAGAQKRMAPVNIANTARKKQKRTNIPKTAVREVLTVDLDDDEVSSSSNSSPQWYLRPEEQTEDKTSKEIEEENNKEPEPSKSTKDMVEITIEDSPVKPMKDKRVGEVCTEMTVTIDDSPVKTAIEKDATSGSDGEAKTENKVPHSKKKLEYPKDAEVLNKMVEIEISPMIEDVSMETANNAEPETNKDTDTIIEIEESPLKVTGQGTSTPKKNQPVPQLTVPESIKEVQEGLVTDDLSEFHPVYQSFIKLCFQLENSEDMKKIVEKKIKTYYRQVPKEYTESEEFIEMVAGKVLSMKAGPEKMYLFIKDIVDELNLQRKMAKSQVLNAINEKKSTTDAEKYYYGADSEYDSKRQRQIRKLEKTLKKLHRAIQKLEDQEVDFDDEEDSVYLLTESDEGSTSNKDRDRQLEKDPKALLQRYKERMVRVHAKFCQLTNTKMPSEPRVQLDARPGQPAGPAKRLEKWINKKVPIGTPLPFPDFHDVLRCVRDANEEDRLGWNEADIMEEARDLFTRCGKKLQRRRQENEWRLAASRISVEVDPADKNNDLMRKLDDNKKIASKKEAEVFNKYADRQSQLKLEAEEIGDKEAEESPGDDDDEEELQSNKESSLEDKEKRKERIKRLLQEKSKKTADEDNTNDVEKKSIMCDNLEAKKGDDVQNSINMDIEKNNEMDNQKDAKSNKKDISLDSKQEDVENKNVSENESVKTIDSDIVEMVSNDKCDTNQTTTTKVKKNPNENDTEHKKCPEKKKTSDNENTTHSISDDSYKIESDVDELNLLQKLHSENEVNSSSLDSDSETPIAISDTLGSSSDSKRRASSDIISIENSSYSESEIKDISDSKDSKTMEVVESTTTKIVEEIVDVNTELECSNIGIEKKQTRTNNEEYNESIEDILLASTDDEADVDKYSNPAEEESNDQDLVGDDGCVNLKDDSLSIGDTVVEGADKAQGTGESNSGGKQDDGSSIDSVTCVLFKDEQDIDSDKQDKKSMKSVKHSSKNDTTENNTDNVNLIDSEKSVQSAHTIELKESSSEKEMEVIEECGDTLSSEEKGHSVDEGMDIVEDVSDALVESANSLDSEGKGKSSDDTNAAINESLKSLPADPTTNQVT